MHVHNHIIIDDECMNSVYWYDHCRLQLRVSNFNGMVEEREERWVSEC